MFMKPYRGYLLSCLFLVLTSIPVFGKALPEAVKSMSDQEYEDYLHGIYLKHYKDPVPYEVWSSLVSALPQPSHQLKYKDNLWDLSQSYFKDHWLWSKLWVANEHIANPHRILKGDTIHFDLKTLSSVNRQGHSVDIRKQFPNVKVPPPVYQKDALSLGEIPSSLPDIKDRLDPPPPDAGFDLEPVPVDKTALLPFYLSEEDLSGQGVVKSKDGYGLSALNGEDVIIFFEGDIIEGGLYTVFENRGPPVFSLLSLFGVNFKGYEIAVKGSVRIIGYVEGTDNLYRARVVESIGSVNPGDRVMNGAIPGYILSQKGTPGSTSGKIIGSPNRDQRYFGMYSFVYLDKGLSNGVQVGDIYHARLNKDTDIKYPYLYDKPAMGKIRVVHANPDTSTAIVVGIRDTIKAGDFFGPSSGVDAVTGGSLKDHEEIEESFDNGEEGLEGMEMEGGGMEEVDDTGEAEDPSESMEMDDIGEVEGPAENLEADDMGGAEGPAESMEMDDTGGAEGPAESMEMDDTGGAEGPAESMEMDDTGTEGSAAGVEAGNTEKAEGTDREEEADEFSDEELDKTERGQSIEEQSKKNPNSGDSSPSPVPSEVKEEFDELKDM